MALAPLEPCSPVLDPQCVQPAGDGGHPFGPLTDLPGAIAGNAVEGVAKAFQAAVGWLVSNTASWWVKTPSPDLQSEPAIGLLQRFVQPITIAVALGALLIVAARMTLTRKALPLVDAGRGLAILAVVSVIGAAVPNLLLQWGDLWCEWVLRSSAQGGFARRMTELVTLPSGTPAALVIVLCLVALVIGIIQALLLLFRGAALIILAGLLPLAAAGMITSATRAWFLRVTGWMLALIFYKPAAAAVYATAFGLIGTGKNLHAVLMGFTMMLISLIAFPVLLKFFTWTTGATESGSGGGILGALVGGATAIGALRTYGFGGASSSGSASAEDHAGYLNQQLGKQEQPPPAPDGAVTDPSAPSSKSGDPDGGQDPPGGGTQDAGDHGWAAPDGGHGEPAGPTTLRTWDKERRRGEDAIRWMGNPGGSRDPDGGPSGAAGEGGAGGGT